MIIHSFNEWINRPKKPKKIVLISAFVMSHMCEPNGVLVCEKADPIRPMDRVKIDKNGVECYRFRILRTPWLGGVGSVLRDKMTVTVPLFDPTLYGLGELVEDGWYIGAVEQRVQKVVYTLYRDIVKYGDW